MTLSDLADKKKIKVNVPMMEAAALWPNPYVAIVTLRITLKSIREGDCSCVFCVTSWLLDAD